MNSKLKKFIFSILAVLIIYNFWQAMAPNEPEVEEPDEVELEVREATPEKEVKPIVEPKVIVDQTTGNEKIEKAYDEYLKVHLPRAQQRDIKCSQEADKIFKDPAFIDVEDPFYKNPMNVIEGLHNVYTNTLVRSEVVTAYTSLSSILINDLYKGTKLTPGEYRNQMGLLEYYCRPEMSLRFVETVMEANKRYKFSPRMKKDIYDMSLSMLESVIGDMFTTNNLIYGLGFFKLLIDNAMLPKEVGDEIVPLFDKVLEHHKGFTNTWQRDKDAGEIKGLWPLLKEDHERRVELGREFKELIGQLKVRYYSR